jgi:DNA-binding CsgD family transcriptional regulator
MKEKEVQNQFTEGQLNILKILQNGPVRQQELAKILGITPPALLHHLEKLEMKNLIIKRVISKIGNAKQSEIALNPLSIQYIRQIMGTSINKYTLITGYGKVFKEHMPDISVNALKKYYIIDRIVCFTTPESKIERNKIAEERKLLTPDKTYEFPFEAYQHLDSPVFQQLDSIIAEEMKNANVILDLTPLTKLLSFKMLEYANKYALPCYYLGKNKENQDSIYWFTNMRIVGEIQREEQQQ